MDGLALEGAPPNLVGQGYFYFCGVGGDVRIPIKQ